MTYSNFGGKNEMFIVKPIIEVNEMSSWIDFVIIT